MLQEAIDLQQNAIAELVNKIKVKKETILYSILIQQKNKIGIQKNKKILIRRTLDYIDILIQISR